MFGVILLRSVFNLFQEWSQCGLDLTLRRALLGLSEPLNEQRVPSPLGSQALPGSSTEFRPHTLLPHDSRRASFLHVSLLSGTLLCSLQTPRLLELWPLSLQLSGLSSWVPPSVTPGRSSGLSRLPLARLPGYSP